MATATLSHEAFLAILQAHLDLFDRFASIAMAVANAEGNLKEAGAVEELAVEEMRLLGRTAMREGAVSEVAATERDIRQRPRMHRQGEKELRRHTTFGEIIVSEPQ